MFVNKEKLNTSRFLCCIMRNLQKNLNLIWQPPISRQTPHPFYLIPLFWQNFSRNEFIKIIIWYHRKQEHTFFLILIFSDLNLITLTLFFVFAKIKIKLKLICVGDVNTFFKHIVIFAIKTIKEPCLKTF